MKRTEKIALLDQVFNGRKEALQKLKLEPGRQARPLTMADLEKMSDQELSAIIEAATGKPCPDHDLMTDEELDSIIAKCCP